MDTAGSITLKDLAEKLNISVSTVSRALRDHPDVNDVTKKKVMQLANELEYEPNELALSLLKGHSNIIAVILPKVAYHLYATAISAIENVIKLDGYTLVTAQTHESTFREANAISALIKNRIAGFIVSVASETKQFKHFEQLKKKNIPLVFFNRDCDEIDASRVIIDNVDAAFKGVAHLIENGYKRIAFLGASRLVQISNRRLAGYKKALKYFDMPIKEEYMVHCEFEKENVKQQTLELLNIEEPPDAIIAFSDQMAVSAMVVIKEMGLKIPKDIGIMGFNNEPMDELISPSLTSIHQPGYEMGKAAGELLMAQIKSKKEIEVQQEILSTQLIIRQSSVRLN